MNHGELSPNYSGILFGITNTFASLPGFAAPITFGYITNNNVMANYYYFIDVKGPSRKV